MRTNRILLHLFGTFFGVFILGGILLGCKCNNPTEPPPMPDVFGIYSETAQYGVKLDVDSFLGIDFGGGGHFVPDPVSGFVDDASETKEGLVSKRSTINVVSSGQWAIWFVQHDLTTSNSEVKDMRDYRGGKLKFWVKCQENVRNLLVGIRSGNVRPGEETSKVILSRYASFRADNQWHEISIPLSDFEGGAPKADLKKIKVFFVIGSSSGETGGTNGDATFWVDDVRWVK